MRHAIKQGDSYWVDIKGSVSSVDPVWANWGGVWAIVPALGESPVTQGNITKTQTSGWFRFQLSTIASAALAVGNYILVVQITNTVVDYKKEVVQDRLTVEQQGITP